MVGNDKLFIAFQKHSWIPDESNKDFHQKNITKNEGEAVAEELVLEKGKF